MSGRSQTTADAAFTAQHERASRNGAAVTGADILNNVRATFRRYVILPPPHAEVALTLWTAATHGQAAWNNATRAVLNSPEKRCGKSRCLEVIAGMAHEPKMTSNITTAALFRIIEKAESPPTIILDEADTVFGTKFKAEMNEDLRGLFNSGYSRHLPSIRCVGPQQEPKEFKNFAMAALAGIGTLPDTITDRAVNITMRRRMIGEKVSPYRQRQDGKHLQVVQAQLSEWISSNVEELKLAEPDMPLEDRAADNWASLLAVADLAGGQWPALGRAAAVVLTREHDSADQNASLSVQLLHDCWKLFTPAAGDFIPSKLLATQLRSDEDAPWADEELTTRRLADRLRGFGIEPRRNKTQTLRGYRRSQFAEPVARYVFDSDETGEDDDGSESI